MSFFDLMNHDRPIDLNESVREHLQFLLNVRQGSLSHMPHYGLPDISETYAELPNSLESFTRAIEACLRQYEPRLRNVRVRNNQEENKDNVISLIIDGVLTGKNHSFFKTSFTSKGLAEVAGASA